MLRLMQGCVGIAGPPKRASSCWKWCSV
jgi:hypothetical protein